MYHYFSSQGREGLLHLKERSVHSIIRLKISINKYPMGDFYMKRLAVKALLTGLILSLASTPAHAMGWAKAKQVPVAQASWGQGFNNGLCSIKTSIYNSSTQTKLLVGLGVLATAGISYLVYRHLNPTDEELCATATGYIHQGNCYIEAMPNIDPLDENQLNVIGWQLKQSGWEPASLRQAMHGSMNSLRAQQVILARRIEKYNKANQYVLSDLSDSHESIIELIGHLEARRAILNTHAHYFRMIIVQSSANTYSKAIAHKTDMQRLVQIIREQANLAQFPFLTFVQWINNEISPIERELKVVKNHGDYVNIYTKKRAELRSLKSDLQTVNATILGSVEYTADQTRKDKYEAEQCELAEKRRANDIAAKKAADEKSAREEKIRLERERLQLQREQNQRERENHQQQHPHNSRGNQEIHINCPIQ